MNEDQVKSALETVKALVEAQPGDQVTKIGGQALLVLLESFLLNQIKQTKALESMAESLYCLNSHR